MFELVSLYPLVVVLSDYPKLLSGLMELKPKKVQHGAEEVEVTNPLACKLSLTSPFGSVNCDKCNFASKQRMREQDLPALRASQLLREYKFDSLLDWDASSVCPN